MAETDTAVLVPDAETAPEETLTPLSEETDETQGTETDPGDGSETEVFTKEDLERVRQEAQEEVRAEAARQLEAVQSKAKLESAEKWFTDEAYAYGIDRFRGVAAFAVREALKGVDPEEIPGRVQAITVKKFLDDFVASAKPHITHEVFTDAKGRAEKRLKEKFPNWTPSRDVAEKYASGVGSGVGNTAWDALMDYIADAAGSEVVKTATAAEQSKKQKASEVTNLQKVSTSGPTKVGGTAVKPSIGSMNQADAAYNKGEISSKEYGELAKRFGVSLG